MDICSEKKVPGKCQDVCTTPAVTRPFVHKTPQTSGKVWTTLGAIHVYVNRPISTDLSPTSSTLGLKVYYDGNYEHYTSCGPNYCCCHAENTN